MEGRGGEKREGEGRRGKEKEGDGRVDGLLLITAEQIKSLALFV
jgi:hypothetical protein